MQTRNQLPNVPQAVLPPTFSANSIRIAVSERYRNQRTPSPIRGSKAQSECFKTIRECLGETIGPNARFSNAFETMVTGGYGQEASLVFDPSQRLASSSTVAQYAREAARVERKIWPRSETRARHKA